MPHSMAATRGAPTPSAVFASVPSPRCTPQYTNAARAHSSSAKARARFAQRNAPTLMTSSCGSVWFGMCPFLCRAMPTLLFLQLIVPSGTRSCHRSDVGRPRQRATLRYAVASSRRWSCGEGVVVSWPVVCRPGLSRGVHPCGWSEPGVLVFAHDDVPAVVVDGPVVVSAQEHQID